MKLANPVGLRTGILRRGIYPVGSEVFVRPGVVVGVGVVSVWWVGAGDLGIESQRGCGGGRGGGGGG